MPTDPRLPSAGNVGSLLVLVVEDEPVTRLSIADYLRDRGFAIVEADNADDAQALFVPGARIDVVFTDVQMPGALDGIELARWLNKSHPDVTVMITSGLTDLTDLARQICEPASVFAKPYDHRAVADRIQVLTQYLRGCS